MSIDPAATLAQRRRELLRRMAAEQGLAGSQYHAIPASDGEPAGELSFAQQEIWLFEKIAPGSAVYNVPTAVRLSGPLDADALEAALDSARLRHSILRAVFEVRQGKPWQRIETWAPVPLPRADVRTEPAGLRERRAIELARSEISRPFDLTASPLLRGLLIQLARDDHLLTLTMHHTVGDALSWEILLADISASYARRAFGRQPEPHSRPEPAPLPVDYGDYARWQRRAVAGGSVAADLRYWRQRLTPAPEPVDLPADRPRPARPSFRGGISRFAIPAAVATRLRALAVAERTTPFAVALAAFFVLMERHSGQSDIAVGTPVACRDHPQLESMVGHFVNTVVVRASVRGEARFRDLVRQIAGESAAAIAHRGLPFERLVAELQPARRADRPPLFQVMFSMRGARLTWQLGELRAAVLPLHNDTAKRDLTVLLLDHDGALTAEFEYNSDIFEPATIERLGRHFTTLLGAMTADPDGRIAVAPMLDAADVGPLHQANSATAQVPAVRIDELFEAQAKQTPAATAVRFREQRLTYAELDLAADALAARLVAAGVAAGATVGICLGRTLELVVAVLAVLKADGAFVPVEPADPVARQVAILRGAAVTAVIVSTEKDVRPELELAGRVVPALRVSLTVPAGAQASEKPARHDRGCAADAAYVLFTSGSTGRPKGVVVEHRQALSYVFAVLERLAVTRPLRYLMVQPLTVDSCLTMLFPALLTGGELHLVSKVDALDAGRLGGYIRDHEIDVLKIAPSHLQALTAAGLAELPRTLLVIGGEAAPWQWMRSVQEQAAGCVVHGHYGPTETTVGVLTARVDQYPAQGYLTTPLGSPLPGCRAWILDDYGELRPPGVAGELYIGGSQVARGYLGQPGLTAAAFLPDPFGEPGERLYRTGDLARYQPDGTIEFLGRRDDQLKISGFRVELGEIDAAMAACPGVEQAIAAVQRRSQPRPEIVGYVVPADPGFDLAALLTFLRDRLPFHMLPTEIVLLPELPLSAHGKVDRNALPAPARRRTATPPATPPASETELRVAGIWGRVLAGVGAAQGHFGADQNFFDAGGYSLLMIALQAELEQEFGRPIELIDLFTATTIEAQAALLSAGRDPDPQAGIAVRSEQSQARGAQQAEAMRRQRRRPRSERTSHE